MRTSLTPNRFTAALSLLAAASLLYACGDDDGTGGAGEAPGEACFETSLDTSLCDPASASFSLASTNPYYPLKVGSVAILEGTEDGQLIRVERRVLPDTEIVAGVETHVLEAIEYIDGQIYEVARNYYVEASDGTVCYFGEDVDFYENGAVVNHAGSWKAGVDGAKPGIIMPAVPKVGDAYYQEVAPAVAEDMARVGTAGRTEAFAGTSYDDVIQVLDSNPIDDETPCEEEEKLYVPNIGEAADTVKRLVSFTPGI